MASLLAFYLPMQLERLCCSDCVDYTQGYWLLLFLLALLLLILWVVPLVNVLFKRSRDAGIPWLTQVCIVGIVCVTGFLEAANDAA